MRTKSIFVLFLSLGAGTASAQDAELAAELKDMSWIGFQQFAEASRVFVRTTEPVKVRVDAQKPKLVVVTLENTTVSIKNNTRPLDTRFFDSPVLGVETKVIEGPSPSVRIEIRLREQVPFKEIQSDNVFALDFQRQ